MTATIWQMIDIARARGCGQSAIAKAYAKGRLPRPDYMTPSGRPLWKPETITGTTPVASSWDELPEPIKEQHHGNY